LAEALKETFVIIAVVYVTIFRRHLLVVEWAVVVVAQMMMIKVISIFPSSPFIFALFRVSLTAEPQHHNYDLRNQKEQ
jgi:hypothetical protein